MIQSRTITVVAGMLFLFLIGLAPPPSKADDKSSLDQSSDIQERGLGGIRRPEAAPDEAFAQAIPCPAARGILLCPFPRSRLTRLVLQVHITSEEGDMQSLRTWASAPQRTM